LPPNERKRDRSGGDDNYKSGYRGGGKRRKHDDSEDSKYDWGKPEECVLLLFIIHFWLLIIFADSMEEKPKKVRVEPNFKPSGLLAQEQGQSVSGTELKYAEPVEARVPTAKWRLYPFKGQEELGSTSSPLSTLLLLCLTFI